MEKVTYEVIENKIEEKKLYDPRYHYYAGYYFTDEEIEDLAFYPKEKRYYKNPDEMLTDYLSISSTFNDINKFIDEYVEDGNINIVYYFELSNRRDAWGKILKEEEKNIGKLRQILEPYSKENMEKEVKHLCKNIKFF